MRFILQIIILKISIPYEDLLITIMMHIELPTFYLKKKANDLLQDLHIIF
jgi:hypothetical protein